MSGTFQPHGYCYQWNAGLVWLHVISDVVIAVAYFTIPLTLMFFIRKRRDLPFSWMFALFGLFIIACGTTHIMEIWNLWHAEYWIAGIAKAITAIASVGTAILLVMLMPQALALPTTNQWMKAKKELENEISERRGLELHLRRNESTFRQIAALMDLTHDAIFVRNLQGEFVFWNKAAETLYGWRKDEVIGKTTHDLLQTVFSEPIEQINAEMARSGYWEGELVHHRRDGTTVIVSSRWAMSSDEGEPAKILESNRDITKRKEEEGKFRSLLEAAPDAVVIVNDDGRIVLVNSQTERMFGYMRSEMLDQEVEMLLPDKFRGKHPGHRNRFYSHPKVRTMGAGVELYARRKDGSEIPVEISLSPLETKGGILVSASIRDISERKRAMETIRQSDEKLRLLIQGVKDYAILMLDSEGRINTWNEGAERINGYRAEEILGTHFSKFYTADDVAADKPSQELTIAEQNGRFEVEGWRVRKDGTRFWANVVITPLRDEFGQLRGFGKVTRDISARKKTEEDTDLQRKEVAQKNAQLLVANNELESFSYSVSHDLRTPLRTIDGFSHALLEDYAGKLDDEGKSHLQRIRSATQRMGNLIDDLLNLARLSRASLHLQLLDVSSLVNSIVSDLCKAQPERQVELQITEGLKATADAGLLRIVLENLLGNAWKFTSKKPVARIEFGRVKCRGISTFFLRDDGAGFDPEYAGRLFGAFQRLHGLSEFEGTGIGLATVWRIIQRHNGHIWAEGMVGHGATFYFTLDEPSPQGAQI